MIHFLRLSRPVNLIIILVTMYGLGWFFTDVNPEFGVQSLDFFLLSISTSMIAAAGNIINDYFDVRADRVNKPERLIIGKYVKRRVAIVTHWGINVLAFGIAIYLSWRLNSFWYLFIHLLSINLLWFYSLYFKRRFLIGNVLIAALTALVPLLVGIYFYQTISSDTISFTSIDPSFSNVGPSFILWLCFLLASFAFLLNLAREMVKDMEDVEGDLLIKAKTLPITLGIKKTKTVVSILLIITSLGASLIWFVFKIPLINLFPVLISGLFTISALVLLPKAHDKIRFKTINGLIKIAMVAGLCTPVFWKIMSIYG